jgi:hypothetical protein
MFFKERDLSFIGQGTPSKPGYEKKRKSLAADLTI